MKRIVLIGIGVLVLLAGAAVFFDPAYRILGFCKGESFYDGRPTTYWVRALRADDPKTRADAVATLRDGGKDALPVLIELLQWQGNGEWETVPVCGQAAGLVKRLGPDAEPAVPALMARLKSADTHLRSPAVSALAGIGRLPDDAIPILIDLLKTDDRYFAVIALGPFRAQALPALPPLRELLKDNDPAVRWNAAYVIGKIGPEAKAAVPDLIATLKDVDALVREHAAEALGDIGPAARDAVQPLAQVLSDKNARVRRDAVRSLGQIGAAARPALPEIRKLLKDKDTKVRGAAARSVQQIEKAAPGVSSSTRYSPAPCEFGLVTRHRWWERCL